MTEVTDHSWILDVLGDLEAYADLHDRPKVVSLLYAARGAVRHALGEVEGKSRRGCKTDEQWFDIALDELARYCHQHGFVKTEQHLVAALEIWAKEQEAAPGKRTVVHLRGQNS